MVRSRRAPRAHQVGDVACRRLCVRDRLERGGPAEIQVGVVLPGEADAAVHLDVELRALVGRRQRERGGHGRGQRQLIASLLGGAGGVPYRRGGELGGHEHVGAVVLDRLEGGDGPAELHAHLGVGGRLLGALGGDAGRLGGDDEAGQVDEHLAPAGDDVRGRTVERDAGGAPGRIEIAGHLHRHAGMRRLDDDGVVARGEDEDVGEATAQDRRRRPGGRTAGHGDVGRERDAAEGGPVGQSRQQPGRQLVGSGRVDDGAGDHGGHEGPRRHGAAELLDHHHELGQPEAGAAPLLGEVQTQPAQ